MTRKRPFKSQSDLDNYRSCWAPIVGVILIGMAINSAFWEFQFHFRGQRALGTYDHSSIYQSGRGGEVTKQHYSFNVRGTDFLASTTEQVPSPVSVDYLPEDPSVNRVSGSHDFLYKSLLGLFGIGLVCLGYWRIQSLDGVAGD